MSWDPTQYLKYSGERLRPALDLLARIPLAAPDTIVDLGCGAGNVTALLAERWPRARIIGVDNSKEMLAQARASRPAAPGTNGSRPTSRPGRRPCRSMWSTAMRRCIGRTTTRDCSRGSSTGSRRAACSRCRCRISSRRRRTWRLRRSSPRRAGAIGWRGRAQAVRGPADRRLFSPAGRGGGATWMRGPPNIFTSCARPHDGVHPVVAWMKGTAMTPFLAALDGDEERAFIDDVSARVAEAYPLLADGRVLVPVPARFPGRVARDSVRPLDQFAHPTASQGYIAQRSRVRFELTASPRGRTRRDGALRVQRRTDPLMNRPDPIRLRHRTFACAACAAARVGARSRGADDAGPHRLVRRQRCRVRAPVRGNGRRRHVAQAQSGPAPELLSRALGSVRCRARRRPHVHLQRAGGRRRPDEQLGRAGRDARHDAAALRRLHARAHDVRRAVLDGTARQPHRAHRHRAHGQPVRRRQHED